MREAVILGVIQGLTEFLPISRIAHLRIIPAFLGGKDPGATYSAVLQLGTLLVVLLYFASDLYGLIRSARHDATKGRPLPRWRSDRATIARTMRRTPLRYRLDERQPANAIWARLRCGWEMRHNAAR